MKVNGKQVVLESPLTLREYLEREGYKTQHVAVERNGEIVPRSSFSEIWLSDGDSMEIVCFVGGG